MTGQISTYFEKVNGQNLSADFKDLILRLVSFDGNKRYTVEEVKSHPWMKYDSYDKEAARATLLA